MWYSESEEIEYTKPIIAEDEDGDKCLLVPTLGVDGYKVIGYDWLSLRTGDYTSCRHFKTAREAAACRSVGYRVYNALIMVEET